MVNRFLTVVGMVLLSVSGLSAVTTVSLSDLQAKLTANASRSSTNLLMSAEYNKGSSRTYCKRAVSNQIVSSVLTLPAGWTGSFLGAPVSGNGVLVLVVGINSVMYKTTITEGTAVSLSYINP